MNKRYAAGFAASIWAMVFLFETPRGDRILRRFDRLLYPEWLIK